MTTTTNNNTTTNTTEAAKAFDFNAVGLNLQAWVQDAKEAKASFANWVRKTSVLLECRPTNFSGGTRAKIHHGKTAKGNEFLMVTQKAELTAFHVEDPAQQEAIDLLKTLRPQDVILEAYFEADPSQKSGLTWYSSRVNQELFQSRNPETRARLRANVKTHVVRYCLPGDIQQGPDGPYVPEGAVKVRQEDGGVVTTLPADAILLRQYVVLRVRSFGKVRPFVCPIDPEILDAMSNHGEGEPDDWDQDQMSFFAELEQGRMEMC